ncbi:MAG TPA: fasciclin domain-containing protein [Sphingomicrobium sp.]|jgi:uncharacterized surface protein with fasciclin (FAS1) repeats|nr:fasciclin domain-containing protein [Sphingomicrobium sp.]
MKRLFMVGVLALAISACGNGEERREAPPPAQTNTSSSQQPSGTIADGLGNSRFASALGAAGMTESLKGAGQNTVLAPTDAAFAKLSPADLDALLKPDNKARLVRLLSNHILPGTMLTADIAKAIDAGGGKAVLATMAGGTLTATRSGDQIIFTDRSGARASVSGTEQIYGNGVMHTVDGVLPPVS